MEDFTTNLRPEFDSNNQERLSWAWVILSPNNVTCSWLQSTPLIVDTVGTSG